MKTRFIAAHLEATYRQTIVPRVSYLTAHLSFYASLFQSLFQPGPPSFIFTLVTSLSPTRICEPPSSEERAPSTPTLMGSPEVCMRDSRTWRDARHRAAPSLTTCEPSASANETTTSHNRHYCRCPNGRRRLQQAQAQSVLHLMGT